MLPSCSVLFWISPVQLANQMLTKTINMGNWLKSYWRTDQSILGNWLKSYWRADPSTLGNGNTMKTWQPGATVGLMKGQRLGLPEARAQEVGAGSWDSDCLGGGAAWLLLSFLGLEEGRALPEGTAALRGRMRPGPL